MIRIRSLERSLFSLNRIAGLVIRPLILLFFLRNGYASLAHDFSLLLTASMSSFIILNNQSYRTAYRYFLDTSYTLPRGLGGRSILQKYVVGTLIHISAFIWIAGIVLWIWIERFDLFAIAVCLIVIEKYFDDDQRFLIYKKLYLKWTVNFTFRTIMPSLALIVGTLIAGTDRVNIYVIAAAMGMALYLAYFQRKFVVVSVKLVRRQIDTGMAGAVREYIIDYKNEFALAQIWAFLTANAIMIDRFLINEARPEIFSEYIFAVNVSNTILTFHNLGYVTFRRPELFKLDANILRSVFAPMNLILPVGLSLAILAAHILSDVMGWPLSTLPVPLILAITGLYLIHAISLPAKEMAFWRLRRGVLLAQECVLFVFPAGAYLLGLTDPLSIVLATIMGVAARFAVLVILMKLAEEKHDRFRLRIS